MTNRMENESIWDDVASIISDENFMEWDKRVENLNKEFTISRKGVKDDGKKEGKEEKADREVAPRNMGS